MEALSEACDTDNYSKFKIFPLPTLSAGISVLQVPLPPQLLFIFLVFFWVCFV